MEAEKAGRPLTIDQIDMYRRERLALSKLTDKQRTFCEVYCRTFDKLLALKEAGYWTPQARKDGKGGQGGSQTKLIEKTFDNVMSSEAVQEYIKLLKQSVASRLGVSMDAIVEQYRIMAFANMDDYVSWDNSGITKFKSSKQLTEAQKAGIMEIVETTTMKGTTIKIKLFNKQTALDRLFEVLKELEEHETRPEGPAKISQTQINVMLQDSTMRRCIEYFAKHLYDKQIALIGNDKDLVAFNENLDKIMHKVTEATSGIANGRRNVGVPQIPQSTENGGESGDRTNPEQARPDAKNAIPKRQGLGKGKKGGDPLDDTDIPVTEGNRYPIDGL